MVAAFAENAGQRQRRAPAFLANAATGSALPTTDTLHLVAMSKDGAGHYFQRLHALDVTTDQGPYTG